MREFLPFSLLLRPNRIPLFSLSHFRRSPFPSASTRISISSSLLYLALFFTLLIFSLIGLSFPYASTRPVLLFLGKVPCFLLVVPSLLYFSIAAEFILSLLSSSRLFSFSLFFCIHMYTRHVYLYMYIYIYINKYYITHKETEKEEEKTRTIFFFQTNLEYICLLCSFFSFFHITIFYQSF